MRGERWIYIGVIFLLCAVIQAQKVFNTWSYEELYRTVRIANKWMDAAKTSCDDALRKGDRGERHIQESSW